MPKPVAITRTALLAAVAALALPGAAEARKVAAWHSGPTVCEAANARPAETSDRQLVRATLCLINQERGRRGLRRLSLNKRLSNAAEGHSRAMVRNNFFSHDSLSGADFIDRIRRAGYLHRAGSWAVAENLAWGSGSRSAPAAVVRSWMNSPGHRANILTGRYREIGIGVVEGAPVRTSLPAATYTTDFGARG
jgi:uncharacterized protein YkwD